MALLLVFFFFFATRADFGSLRTFLGSTFVLRRNIFGILSFSFTTGSVVGRCNSSWFNHASDSLLWLSLYYDAVGHNQVSNRC